MPTEEQPLQPRGDIATTQKTSRVFYGWWVVLASGIGLALHIGPIIVPTFGVFLKPLSQEFGWSRAQISLAFSLCALALTLSVPFIGRLVDYAGARRVILPATSFFGLSVFALAFLSTHILQFYAVYIVIGIVASGTTPVPYSKVITRWFDRKRGLALGLPVAVNSLSFTLMPFVAHALIAALGWRHAYMIIGIMVVGVAIPVVGLLLKETPQQMGLEPDGGIIDHSEAPVHLEEGVAMSFHEARHTGTFWLIVGSFFLMSVGFHACIIHLVPLLTDRGISPGSAALAASLAGAGAFLARIVVGYLLDLFFAASVAACLFFASTMGLFFLWSGVTGYLPFAAAFLVGVGQGAELDIIPYMVSRYFGLQAFAEIYGYLFAVFTLGGVVGPMLMGMSFDATGSYGFILGVLAIGTLVAVGLMTRLGPYRVFKPALQPA
jgi:MFS family permease